MIDQLKKLKSLPFSPKIGLGLIKYRLETQLKKEISEFDIVYGGEDSQIKFRIPDERGYCDTYYFDDKEAKLARIIDTELKKHLEDSVTVDLFVIKVKKKAETKKTDISAQVFFRDENGEKKFVPIKM